MWGISLITARTVNPTALKIHTHAHTRAALTYTLYVCRLILRSLSCRRCRFNRIYTRARVNGSHKYTRISLSDLRTRERERESVYISRAGGASLVSKVLLRITRAERARRVRARVAFCRDYKGAAQHEYRG